MRSSDSGVQTLNPRAFLDGRRLYFEYSPGADGSGHHHPTVGVGHMLSGAVLSAFGDAQPIAIREGESLVDVAHQIHTISRNASKTEPLRFVIALHRQAGRTCDGLARVNGGSEEYDSPVHAVMEGAQAESMACS